jgi:hypothetical protein
MLDSKRLSRKARGGRGRKIRVTSKRGVVRPRCPSSSASALYGNHVVGRRLF